MTAVTQRGTAVTSVGAGTPTTVATPSGTTTGDRVIIAISVDDDGAYSTISATAGGGGSFTVLGHDGVGGLEWLTVLERIWTGSDSSPITVNIPSGSDWHVAVTSWQASDTAAASTLGTFLATTGSNPSVPATTNGSVDDYNLICLGLNNQSGTGTPSGWTALTSLGSIVVYGDALATTGSTGTVALVGSGTQIAVQVSVPAVSGPVATLDQEGFRWRNDDGSETTATWAGSQDTDVTAPLSANIRLRALIDQDGP